MSTPGPRSVTEPYGHPTEEEINARIRKGIEEGVRKIEEARRMDLLFNTLRLMEPEERMLAMRNLVNVFGIGAGL
jgi:hypothetical protein